ncbi:hypothetical protein BOTCAL_1088g00030 [Botryotinia calthae]|uniref:Plastocyanin-like domain-containing protein n=1 Tax=Botryotinia calthae TaxID=38488 RepID=A0A4Y8CGD8_9HELO|nr:hypothetical protein BOTCAL_1088g00030 [Botryotinia calthae]
MKLPLTLFNALPNAVTVFLGLAILQAACCHPILNAFASDSTSTIHIRDVAPATASDAPANFILTAADPLSMTVHNGSSIRKGPELSTNTNKREKNWDNPVDNPRLPATLYADGEIHNNDHDDHYNNTGIGMERRQLL